MRFEPTQERPTAAVTVAPQLLQLLTEEREAAPRLAAAAPQPHQRVERGHGALAVACRELYGVESVLGRRVPSLGRVERKRLELAEQPGVRAVEPRQRGDARRREVTLQMRQLRPRRVERAVARLDHALLLVLVLVLVLAVLRLVCPLRGATRGRRRGG